MRFLKFIFITIASILAILLVITSFLPSSIDISRAILINAPINIPFDIVNSPENREQWSPWPGMEKNMIYEYKGPEKGKGSMQLWKSDNKNLGSGKFEIKYSNSENLIKTRLFLDGEEYGNGIWTFVEKDGRTEVTWNIKIRLTFFIRWIGLTFDALIGPQMEIGLKNIKRISEEEKKS